MKKMARKNFRGGPLFSSKAHQAPASSSSPSGGPARRSTWADKIRDKLPPLGETEYEVLWERGVLGVIFLESETDGIPFVSKATESCISPAVGQGDVLKFVNVVRSKDHSFSDFFKILATMKKPVLLRFERLSAATPSSDEDEAAQLFGVQRASSTNAVNNAQRPNADEEVANKFNRANSVPQKDPKPPKATRGAFWRAPSAKDSAGPANPANGAQNERVGASQGPRRAAGSRDHQVSPRDAVNGGGSASHSPLGQHEYQVYWETGSLGLFFGENRATNLPVVTRSTPSANPVVRRAVAVNDTLVSANGIRSADYTFESFFGRLQQMNKPVRLVFRKRQPTDQAVVVKQGESQQQKQQQQQQLQQQLQLRQQQMREQQQQQEYREQQHREQEHREQQMREQQHREQEHREQQMREQQHREQEHREQQMREQQMREQQQLREKQREQQFRDQQLRDQQMREQQDQQRRQQEAESRNRTPSVTVDTSSAVSPAESRSHHGHRTPSPNVKRAGTPPPRPPSPQGRMGSDTPRREHRHADRGRTPPPSSPLFPKDRANTRQQDSSEHDTSTNYDVSPKANASPVVRSSPRVDISPTFGMSPSDSPNIGSSPKVSSSPLASPISPVIASEVSNETSYHAQSPVANNENDTPSPAGTKDAKSPSEKTRRVFGNTNGRRSRNTSEEQKQYQKATIAVPEEQSVLSPVSKLTHLSPTEPWDLPERIPSPTVKAGSALAVEDDDDDVDIAVPVSSSADVSFESVAVHGDAELAEESELVEEGELIEEAESADDVGLGVEVELADEAEVAEETEPVLSSLPIDNSDDNDNVEVGMLADVEMGVAVEETESEVSVESLSGSDQNSSPWDLEPPVDRHKARSHSSSTSSSRESSENSFNSSASETSKVDFAVASESADEFANDLDISSDIDIVDGDIMMQQVPKEKVGAATPPKPSKQSLHANLSKYKKKGKTSRGVIKLPALGEEEALTVPLVAPNAVNTTVQVRGRPKPKLTMADTPDSTTYLIKWKENRSIGLQLKEVRFAKGTFPLVTDVCQEPCCELLRHICVGDVIIEINGRNTSTMGVKKTVNFLKTCSKTTLMKIRHGPAFMSQRVSATV